MARCNGGVYSERGSYVDGKWQPSREWTRDLPEGFEERADDLIESEPEWLSEVATGALWSQFGYYSVDDMPVDDQAVFHVRRAIVFYLENGREPEIAYRYGGDRPDCVSDLDQAVFS